MNYEQLKPLLRWRVKNLKSKTPEDLVEALSVEGLPTEPARYRDLVFGFRKRRQEERLKMAKRFLHQ